MGYVSTYHDNTALQVAAFDGHLQVVRALIAGGADVNQRTGKDGTALASAVAGGHKEVIATLREAGAR